MKKKKEKNLRSCGLANLQTTKTLTRHFVTPSPKGRGERAAFTLAEVLITLGIIGVVAAMTIPTLVANYQEKSWSTSASVFERKLTEALRVMNTQQTLAGYTTTEDFVDELKKHIKIIKTCNNDKLDECFPKEFLWGSPDPETKQISTFTDSSKLRRTPYGTNTVGIQFANGTVAVMAYNPECKQDPYSNQVTGTSCISMLYDTSGEKKPNQSGKDLRAFNVNKLWSFKVGDLKFSTPFQPEPMSFSECTGNTATHSGSNVKTSSGGKAAELGIVDCYHPNDYWAGAVKNCGGVSRMPTVEQLEQIVAELYPDATYDSYGDPNCPKDDSGTRTKCRDTKKAILFGFSGTGGAPLNDTNSFRVWSTTDPYGTSSKRDCSFGSSAAYCANAGRSNSTNQAVCLAD